MHPRFMAPISALEHVFEFPPPKSPKGLNVLKPPSMNSKPEPLEPSSPQNLNLPGSMFFGFLDSPGSVECPKNTQLSLSSDTSFAPIFILIMFPIIAITA